MILECSVLFIYLFFFDGDDDDDDNDDDVGTIIISQLQADMQTNTYTQDTKLLIGS